MRYSYNNILFLQDTTKSVKYHSQDESLLESQRVIFMTALLLQKKETDTCFSSLMNQKLTLEYFLLC